MTAPRRPLRLLAAAAALALPACLSIETTPLTPPEVRDRLAAQAAKAAEAARKDQFAELPSRPGDTVSKRPVAPPPKDATAKSADAVPPSPPAPSGGVNAASGPPGPFPLGPSQPPPPPDPPLLLAVRAYVEGKPDRAIEFLRALDGPNQELVLALVPVLARGATADLAADPAGVAVLVDQLRAAAARLEPRADLRVENVYHCKQVDGFGRYDPWPAGHTYRPNDQAQLYFEVRNLAGQSVKGPRGETHLTRADFAVQIRDANGGVVDQPDPEDRRRRVPAVRFGASRPTRGPIHDFHVYRAFQVPSAPGVYTVTVEVRDPAGRVARTAPVELRVAGP